MASPKNTAIVVSTNNLKFQNSKCNKAIPVKGTNLFKTGPGKSPTTKQIPAKINREKHIGAGTSLVFLSCAGNSPQKTCRNNLRKTAVVPAAVIIKAVLSQRFPAVALTIKALLAKPLKGGIPDIARAPMQKVAAVIGMRLPKPPKFFNSLSRVA